MRMNFERRSASAGVRSSGMFSMVMTRPGRTGKDVSYVPANGVEYDRSVSESGSRATSGRVLVRVGGVKLDGFSRHSRKLSIALRVRCSYVFSEPWERSSPRFFVNDL